MCPKHTFQNKTNASDKRHVHCAHKCLERRENIFVSFSASVSLSDRSSRHSASTVPFIPGCSWHGPICLGAGRLAARPADRRLLPSAPSGSRRHRAAAARLAARHCAGPFVAAVCRRARRVPRRGDAATATRPSAEQTPAERGHITSLRAPPRGHASRFRHQQ